MPSSTTYQPTYLDTQPYPYFTSTEQQEQMRQSEFQDYSQLYENNCQDIPPTSFQGTPLTIHQQQEQSYPYHYQYPYAPQFQVIDDPQESSPPTLISSQQSSSSPISPSFSIPLEYRPQTYPYSLDVIDTSSTFASNLPSSSSPPLQPEPQVAKMPQLGYDHTYTQQTSNPFSGNSQMMSRGHTWPMTFATIEGRFQSLALQPETDIKNPWQDGESTERHTPIGQMANEATLSHEPPFQMRADDQSFKQVDPGNIPLTAQIPMWNTINSRITAEYAPATLPSPLTPFAPQSIGQASQSPNHFQYRPQHIGPDLTYRYTPASGSNPFPQSPIIHTQKPRSVPLAHSLSLPFVPTFVVRPSLEMLTSKVSKPKRRLPTPPRVSGWIPPEQRPIPSGNMGLECRPRLLPVPPPSMFPLPTNDQQLVTQSPSSLTPVDVGSSSHPISPSADYPGNEGSFECDTFLPQVQSQPQAFNPNQNQDEQTFLSNCSEQNQNTFAFAMSAPSLEDTRSIVPAQQDMNFSNMETVDLINRNPFYHRNSDEIPLLTTYLSNTRGYTPLARRDLLTRAPFVPSLPRPGSEPNPRKARPKSGKRPYTGLSNLERKSRIEYKLATSIGKRFICPDCEEPFTRRNDLERHARSKHTGETPFQCPGCDKAFSRKDKLDQHIEKSPICRAIAPPREERVRRRRGKVETPIYRHDPRLLSRETSLSSNPLPLPFLGTAPSAQSTSEHRS